MAASNCPRNSEAQKGVLLQAQKFSVNDGEGIRTTIFLPGCPLRCLWCANPEGWDTCPKLAVYHDKCIGCGACRKACPKGISPPERNESHKHTGKENCDACKDCDTCDACGICVSACPANALAILCEHASVESVVEKIARDAVFFRHSGGGVTFSGGEPAFQPRFLRALVHRCSDLGISSWIETCGYFAFETVGDIFEKLEHVFFDIKCMDAQLHQKLTGVDNALILENAEKIYALKIPLTVRVPLVKGANFTEQNLAETAAFMRDHLPGADIELLPYHSFGKEKYAALGMEDRWVDFNAPDQREMEAARALFQSMGISVVSYR